MVFSEETHILYNCPECLTKHLQGPGVDGNVFKATHTSKATHILKIQ